MNIALLGATGRVGGAVLAACVERGHTVRALVRSPSRLMGSERVTVLEGNVLARDDLDELLTRVDAVVSALGTPPWGLSTITAPAMEALLGAMRRRRVDRVIALSALGIGESRTQVDPLARLVLAAPSPYARDKAAMEKVVKASDVEWTLVRPWILREGPAGGVEAKTVLSGRARPLTFADCGQFIADELEQRRFVRQAVSLSGLV